MREQLSAKSTASPGGLDEQVFQIDSRLTGKGRKGREEDREAHRLIAEVREADLRGGMTTEQLFANLGLGGDDAMGKLFVFRQAFDHPKHDCRVAGCRGNDPKTFVTAHRRDSIRPRRCDARDRPYACMTPQDATEYIWLAWLISWFAAAVWSGRTVKRPALRNQLWYRLVTITGALLMFGTFGIRRYDIAFWRLDGGIGWLFAAITAASVLFMWWARLHLGRLWSGSVTRKADHALVDTGPYAIVRHPIYTGLLVAIGATVCVRATAQSFAGAALVATGIYLKARLEEAFLREQLGTQAYDAYARRVPMLVPFARVISKDVG